MLKPSDYKAHHMGDGKRFHVRPCADKFKVYGAGLYHICDCDRHEAAEMIADTLEVVANAQDMVHGITPDMREYLRASEAAALNAKIADVHRASEAARLQRLREIGRADDAREEFQSAICNLGEERERLDAEGVNLHWLAMGRTYRHYRLNVLGIGLRQAAIKWGMIPSHLCNIENGKADPGDWMPPGFLAWKANDADTTPAPTPANDHPPRR